MSRRRRRNYVKKTGRPWRYPPARRAEWVAFAIAHSCEAAARKFGVSPVTVNNHLRAAGHTPRRPGNYTNAEIAAMKGNK